MYENSPSPSVYENAPPTDGGRHSHQTAAQRNEKSMYENINAVTSGSQELPSVIGRDHHGMSPTAELTIGEVIGKGSFGTVYLGVYRGQLVALKSLQSDNQEFEREVALLFKLQHLHIVTMLGIVTADDTGQQNKFIAMEFMNMGNVHDRITTMELDNHGHLSTADRLGIVVQIARGMAPTWKTNVYCIWIWPQEIVCSPVPRLNT